LKPEGLRKAITARTKLLILNSPCNPTGAVYSKDELEALSKIIVERDLYLISDEIYEHIVFDGVHGVSPASLSPEMRQRTATVNGFSKAFAMQGLRLGYIGAPAHWAKAMVAVQSHAAHHPSTISQYAALGCLAASAEILPGIKPHYQEARDYTVSRLKNIPGVSWNDPQGAFYIFLSVPSKMGSLALAEYLLEKWDLATVPGVGFGCEGFLRLSFANSMGNLKRALDRLEQGLQALSPGD
jgi:aspartate aminotransferase